MNVISASEFKAKCLSIVDEVSESGSRFVISKRGRLVAELIRYVNIDHGFAQEALRGTARIVANIDTPVTPPDEWHSVSDK
ncbi:MAG: type II toxin-antitoxin system Phd/YefM family antitoxin [Spirochaetaceae bacterium]|nr:MAG: type II toxin-antitoxin system Phd/YefM family antitoxin [Spirochaetaceae bacterium]